MWASILRIRYLEESREYVRFRVDEQDEGQESGESSIPDGWSHSGQRRFGTACNVQSNVQYRRS